MGASEKNVTVAGSIASMINDVRELFKDGVVSALFKGEVVSYADSVLNKSGFYPIATGGGVSDKNIPSTSYGYSVGFVISRGGGTCIIVLFNRGDDFDEKSVAAVKTKYNYSAWSDWKYLKSV